LLPQLKGTYNYITKATRTTKALVHFFSVPPKLASALPKRTYREGRSPCKRLETKHCEMRLPVVAFVQADSGGRTQLAREQRASLSWHIIFTDWKSSELEIGAFFSFACCVCLQVILRNSMKCIGSCCCCCFLGFEKVKSNLKAIQSFF
jgi:hypothetical protein